MGLNIKNEDVCELARTVASRTGETLTDAIRRALQERLERLDAADDVAERRRRLYEIIEALPPVPPGLTSDTSDLYDEDGLPA